MSKPTLITRLNELLHLGQPALIPIMASHDRDSDDLTKWEMIVLILISEGGEDAYARDLIASLDDCAITRELRVACKAMLGDCPEPIDITDPEQASIYVGADGYVNYRTPFGILGFHALTERTGAEPGKSNGWWSRAGDDDRNGPVHFKTDDYHVRPSLDAGVTIIPYPQPRR